MQKSSADLLEKNFIGIFIYVINLLTFSCIVFWYVFCLEYPQIELLGCSWTFPSITHFDQNKSWFRNPYFHP